jgi:hypothetical protein
VVEFGLAMPAGDLSGNAIDQELDIGFFAKMFASSGDQRRLDRTKHDFFVDILVAMQRVNDSQNFTGIHD